MQPRVATTSGWLSSAMPSATRAEVQSSVSAMPGIFQRSWRRMPCTNWHTWRARRAAGGGGLDGLEQGALDEEVGTEDVVRLSVAGGAGGFEQADVEHLAGVVPLVDGVGD